MAWVGLGLILVWVGKLEGSSHLKVLGIDGSIILIGFARKGSSLDSDNLSLVGDLCQAVVKTTVNQWVA